MDLNKLRDLGILYLMTQVKHLVVEQNVDDLCVYKQIKDGIVVFLVLYVDDILLIENDIETLSNVKNWLVEQFQM